MKNLAHVSGIENLSGTGFDRCGLVSRYFNTAIKPIVHGYIDLETHHPLITRLVHESESPYQQVKVSCNNLICRIKVRDSLIVGTGKYYYIHTTLDCQRRRQRTVSPK